VRACRDLGMHTLMCGDGGNDVGALKTADVGISLLSGFGNVNADLEETGKEKKSAAEAEKQLEEQAKAEQEKRAANAKLQAAEFKAKRAELMSKQKQWLEEEIRARAERGETGFSAQMAATMATSTRLRQELAKEQQALSQKYGIAAASAQQLDLMDGEAGELPMVKLGDASIAAPFTSKLPSIRSCVDIIRQGHCTLVSTVQQQQILMLHCLISAYSLSVLSLEGSRSSESQMIASGLLLSVASIAFSFARPLDRLSSVLPLGSIFHPALILSVLGQLAIHAACMYSALSMAKAHMGEHAIKEVIAFQKKADKDAEAGVEEASSAHKPNLLNTMVFLVETSQQVAVMLVNYKGRPWMKGATENPGLLYSLAACVAGVVIAAWEVVPQLNDQLGLVALPDDETRYKLLLTIATTLVGSFVWDRLCVAVFAPRVFASQVDEIRSLSISDFWGPNSSKHVGMAVAALAWLYFTEGNMIMLAGGYWLYRKSKAAPPAQPPATR